MEYFIQARTAWYLPYLLLLVAIFCECAAVVLRSRLLLLAGTLLVLFAGCWQRDPSLLLGQMLVILLLWPYVRPRK